MFGKKQLTMLNAYEIMLPWHFGVEIMKVPKVGIVGVGKMEEMKLIKEKYGRIIKNYSMEFYRKLYMNLLICLIGKVRLNLDEAMNATFQKVTHMIGGFGTMDILLKIYSKKDHAL